MTDEPDTMTGESPACLVCNDDLEPGAETLLCPDCYDEIQAREPPVWSAEYRPDDRKPQEHEYGRI